MPDASRSTAECAASEMTLAEPAAVPAASLSTTSIALEITDRRAAWVFWVDIRVPKARRAGALIIASAGRGVKRDRSLPRGYPAVRGEKPGKAAPGSWLLAPGKGGDMPLGQAASPCPRRARSE